MIPAEERNLDDAFYLYFVRFRESKGIAEGAPLEHLLWECFQAGASAEIGQYKSYIPGHPHYNKHKGD